jgi:hypothetical protein
MAAASHPRFPRKPLELRLINKAPLKHAHDDEVSDPYRDQGDLGEMDMHADLPTRCSGHSTRNAAPNGMDSDTTHFRRKEYVHSYHDPSYFASRLTRNPFQLYYMAEQRKILPHHQYLTGSSVRSNINIPSECIM